MLNSSGFPSEEISNPFVLLISKAIFFAELKSQFSFNSLHSKVYIIAYHCSYIHVCTVDIALAEGEEKIPSV